MGIFRWGKRRSWTCGALLPGHRCAPTGLATAWGWANCLCAAAALPIFKVPPVDFWLKERECLTNTHESKAPPPSQFPGRKRRGIGTPPRRTSAQGPRSRCVLGRQRPNSVSLGRAKADSPSPRDGPKYPIPQIGSGALPRNIQAGGGNWRDRVNTMAPYTRAKMARSYGWSIETGAESVSGNQRSQKTGRRRSGNCGNDSKPGTTRSSMSSGKENIYSSRIGRTFSSRTTPSHQSEQKRRMKRMDVRPCTSRRRLVGGPLATSVRMTLKIISDGDCRREFRSGPRPESFNEIGLSRRPSIRNCGCFVV